MDSVLNRNNIVYKYQDMIAIICLALSIGFFIWNAPYGLAIEDESAYLTVPQRLMMGDSYITDEWHLAQLFTVFLYLPYKAYIYFVGSTEGIILFFRYLFIPFQSMVSIIVYRCLRKYGMLSILAALIFFLHIPFFRLMSLNYYTIGLAFALLAGVLMATTKKFSKATFYVIGLFIACTVLCNPMFAFVYFLYSICMIIYELNKKKKCSFFRFSEVSFSLKAWLWITVGILTLAVGFFAFLFSRTNLNEIIKNLPMLFTDSEYLFSSSGSGLQNVFTIQKSLAEMIKINPYLFAAFALLFVVIIFDKKRIHRNIYLLAATIIFFAYIIYITISIKFPNYSIYLFPLTLLGLTSYIISENKDKDIFIFVWILGILYTVCLDISSAMGFIGSSMGFLISNVASVIFIRNIMVELLKQSKIESKKSVPNRHKHNGNAKSYNNKLTRNLLASVLVAALLTQVIQEGYVVSNKKLFLEHAVLDSEAISGVSIFSGVSIQRDSKEKLNVTIQNGPEKGIKTTFAKEKIYDGMLNDLSYIKGNYDGPILIMGNFPWCYLYLNMPFATYSTWFVSDDISHEIQRLLSYYKLHPKKAPQVIYVPKILELIYVYLPERATAIIDELDENFDFTVQESYYGYTLKITG